MAKRRSERERLERESRPRSIKEAASRSTSAGDPASELFAIEQLLTLLFMTLFIRHPGSAEQVCETIEEIGRIMIDDPAGELGCSLERAALWAGDVVDAAEEWAFEYRCGYSS